MKTFAEKVIEMCEKLDFKGDLPEGYKVINPFVENSETSRIIHQFYSKYYSDHHKRKFIIAINPGRLGAGTTGVPFTDTKRLESECDIVMESAKTYEVSATFIYNMIHEMGGVSQFYKNFYIQSVFPMAIVQMNKKGNWVNANYYDNKELFSAVKSKIVESLIENIALGLDTEKVFVLGKKNAKFIQEINNVYHFFGKIITLEHPRYIQQYKLKDLPFYLKKYKTALS